MQSATQALSKADNVKKRMDAVAAMRRALEACAADAAAADEVFRAWQEASEALQKCVRDNNFRVCLGALECFDLIVPLLGEAFRAHTSRLLTVVVDKAWAHAKAEVRAKGVDVVLQLLSIASPGASAPSASPRALCLGTTSCRPR